MSVGGLCFFRDQRNKRPDLVFDGHRDDGGAVSFQRFREGFLYLLFGPRTERNDTAIRHGLTLPAAPTVADIGVIDHAL